MADSKQRVRVWDPLVRVFHWSLVVGFFTAYLTEDDLLDVHVVAGYVVMGLVVFRLAWGVIGSHHARFGNFVKSPAVTIAYLRSILSGHPSRFLGHNPAGAAMIVALLVCLAVTVVSGLYVYAYEENEGPLAGLVASGAIVDDGVTCKRGREGDEHDNDAGDAGEFWEDTHEVFANLTLLLVLFHVAGVIIAGIQHRENLVLAMLTGNKRE